MHSETNLIALTPQGQLKWTEEVGSSPGGPSPGGPSPVTVTLGPDGTIYAARPDSSASGGGAWRLQAFNSSGDETWSAQFPGQLSAPSIDPETANIYLAGAVAARSEPFNPRGNSVAAVQPGGVIAWAIPIGQSTNLAPTVGSDGTVYSAGAGLATATPAGTLQNNVSFGEEGAAGPTTLTPQGQVAIPTGNGIALGTRRPGRDADRRPGGHPDRLRADQRRRGNLFFGAGARFAAASLTGRILWTVRTSAATQSPAMASNGTLYVPDGSLLRAYG